LRVVNALLSPIILSQVRLFSDLKLIENRFFYYSLQSKIGVQH
jgi:hypothetical protein